MKRVMVLLLVLALIAGVAGCPAESDHDPEPPTEYELTIWSSAGGSVAVPGEGTFTYETDTVVSLVAEADDGYSFVSWTGDVDTISNTGASTTIITMNDSYSIAATFELIPPVQHRLTISSTVGGSAVTPGEGVFTYDAGTVVSISAEADRGYKFVNWTGNVDMVANVDAASTTVTMANSYSIEASFLEVTEIWDWYGLDAVRDDLSGNYVLMSDLDSTTAGYTELASPTANGGKGWEPIGYGHPVRVDLDTAFSGSLDGQGYEIRDLFISRIDEASVGLLGCVGWGGHIRGIALVGASVSADSWVGGLVGWNSGTVSNCSSSGSVIGVTEVGGLVGRNPWGTVSDSYSTASVTSVNRAGGVVGLNLGTVRNSHYNYDKLLINGEKLLTIGALLNEDFEEWLANGKFIDVNTRLAQEDGYYVVSSVCDFKQLLVFGQDCSLRFRLKDNLDLSSEPSFYIPYLAGQFDGNGHKILNAKLNSSLVSQAGVFGYLASCAHITRLVVENVNIVSSSDYVGGVVGLNRGTVSDSYSTGTITGVASYGGLVGENSSGSVTNSYSICSVIGGHGGGLVGYNQHGTVSNSFWDVEASGTASSDGGTGRTTAEMKDIATFAAAGWDICAVTAGVTDPACIWNIVDGETYPFLSWQSVS